MGCVSVINKLYDILNKYCIDEKERYDNINVTRLIINLYSCLSTQFNFCFTVWLKETDGGFSFPF